MAYEKKYKAFFIEYKNDKNLDEIINYDRHVYQYYKHIDMWNEQRVSVFNQMPANAQNNNQ